MSDSYSRLYHRFSVEFPAVYADDRALATWVRLLMLADASWPMRPPLPRSARAKPLAVLIAAGLVSAEGESYTVRGLDAERTRRSDAGRTGAAVRWQNDRTANAMPRRDETETSRDETRDSPPPPAERGHRENGTSPRSTGDAPRQQGTSPRQTGNSPRQVREGRKRAPVPMSTAEILRRAAAAGHES